MAEKKRNYKEEYAKYHGTPEQKKRRAQRNAARRKAMKQGKVRKGDGKEVDHLGFNRKGKLNNKKVKVVSRKANRKRQPKRDGSHD
jgi:hypothetical protein